MLDPSLAFRLKTRTVGCLGDEAALFHSTEARADAANTLAHSFLSIAFRRLGVRLQSRSFWLKRYLMPFVDFSHASSSLALEKGWTGLSFHVSRSVARSFMSVPRVPPTVSSIATSGITGAFGRWKIDSATTVTTAGGTATGARRFAHQARSYMKMRPRLT
jgi:hypothetical protein